MNLQNIWGRVIGNVVINISSSNIFQKMFLIEKYIQNCQAGFGLFECEWVKAVTSTQCITEIIALCSILQD